MTFENIYLVIMLASAGLNAVLGYRLKKAEHRANELSSALAATEDESRDRSRRGQEQGSGFSWGLPFGAQRRTHGLGTHPTDVIGGQG